MKKIVMLTCLKANTVCTGAGCPKASTKEPRPSPAMAAKSWNWRHFSAATAAAFGMKAWRKSSNA